ncbi:hypothetical protein HY411_00565 [Candidatus Gottesmanbacteria bacterium]|nr:hypothetical protein [Candidatus Gottesmanbacteria bacterium]
MRDITIILLASTLYIGSVFFVTQGKTFRLDSDYDSNFPIISYVVDTVRNEKRFPFWNPYVTTGISVLGDPLSGVTYLPYLLPMLAFGVPDGWWVVVGLHAFLAGVFMWMWLRKLLGRRLSLPLWGGLIYMGAGALSARVAAGHIEKVLSYPWHPLFLMFILKKGQTLGTAALMGAVMGVVFLTGDVYGLLFMAIFYGAIGVTRAIEGEIRRVRWIQWIREIMLMMSAFLLVGGVKLVPFIFHVWPVMSRYSTFDAARGSIHAFLTWMPLIVPWGVSFYDRPVSQQLFGFWYNWYEYYAFIGLPIVFLFWLPKVIKRRETQLLLLLFFVGILYIARGYPYSVFYWLEKSVPVLSWFRAPQRMYGALTSVVVALIVLCAKRVVHPQQYVFLWAMLLITFVVNAYQMTHAFEIPRRDEESVVREMRRRDAGEITVATFACCTQTFLVRERIRVINYYYGWLPKGAPRFTTADGSEFSLETIRMARPTYIIAPKDMSVGEIGYDEWFEEGEIVVWRESILT